MNAFHSRTSRGSSGDEERAALVEAVAAASAASVEDEDEASGLSARERAGSLSATKPYDCERYGRESQALPMRRRRR